MTPEADISDPRWWRCPGAPGRSPHLVVVQAARYGPPDRCQSCVVERARRDLHEGVEAFPPHVIAALLDDLDQANRHWEDEIRGSQRDYQDLAAERDDWRRMYEDEKHRW